MNYFDGSHDFNHIKRVLNISRQILAEIESTDDTENGPLRTFLRLDPTIITLSTLLHDIGDRKYLKEGEDGNTMVRDLLLFLGSGLVLVEKVLAICLGVAYSSEVQHRAYLERLIEKYPELAVIQDADQLDSIGAVGTGRVFTYGAVRIGREMEASMEIFGTKLFKLEVMMKTVPGRRLAKKRSERLRVFKAWWSEETEAGNM
ncbi:hypothetical protein D0Z07_8240 [Hyphodiscus hymeniophilus]|uniref:HD domain-containing protein n=1 Tax=Hyphodiscus hymeniophilus TaxID=353542 RepID=A0A9P6VEA4_9HELO|nr:hypothetical protein D0Z07_8240 [Hyphodiscus hymeniophilus]